ncbi:MAG: transcriptional regulator [Myxococcales bacterium]|nr:transcriptional regulator [Myxococcales bacterium]
MYDYREYCPIAKASQILCERWTLLIVRELLCGSRRFSQLRRYLPRISPSLLKARLRMLEAEGVVARVRGTESRNYEYELTAAGRELESVVIALGQWSTRWQYEKFKDDAIYIDGLMRDLELTLRPGEMPGKRSVLRFLFDDAVPDNRWYIVVDGERVESCDDERGFDVDVYFGASARTIADILLAKVSLRSAIRDGRLKVTGSRAHVDSIERWFGLAPYVEAPAALPFETRG